MILTDKHEDISTSMITLSMKILKIMKKNKVLSFYKLFSLLEYEIKNEKINKDKVIWAILFLYAFKKIEYNKNSDVFIYIN